MAMTINEQQMMIKPKIVTLGKHQLFLGITWLKEANPNIDWKRQVMHWRNEDSPLLQLFRTEDQRMEPLYFPINNIKLEINVKSNTSQQLFNESDKPKKESDPRTATPKKFHQFLKVFDKTESENLPPRQSWDHKIELEPDFTPKQMPIYHLTLIEKNELDKFISENL
jgi:hypothetical protein